MGFAFLLAGFKPKKVLLIKLFEVLIININLKLKKKACFKNEK